MMDNKDVVWHLRRSDAAMGLCNLAADEIESLRREVDRLRGERDAWMADALWTG